MSRSRPYDSTESRRSPRDRSPAPQRYPEPREPGQQRGAPYRANDVPSRPSADLRLSNDTFPSNRESLRDGANRQAPRDHAINLVPPRAPKAFSDAPTGPRAIFTPESNTRGGGRGRGRGWHDDVRDRGRDSEYDYRDRRDARGAPSFRSDRGREREWMDRDRRDRDGSSFRGRRPSSPGAGYSRGRGRVRGDWDSRGHGRGYDDRDRFRGRSRSPPPSRRASVASPPPQAPEVPAFGTVINHAPVPTSVSDIQQISTAASVSIPTGPRSTRDQIVLKNWQPSAVRAQSYAVPQWSRSSSVIHPPETSMASTKPIKSTAVADLVAKKTADSSPVPALLSNSQATPAMIRLPLARDDTFEDDDSDSESGEDMEDFFEAETQKVVDQLAQTSLGDVDRSFTYASQDPVSLYPILEPPEKLYDDGNEVENNEISASTYPMPPRPAMPEYQSEGDESDAEYLEQLAAVRPRMNTPPTSSLPFGPLKQKWYENDEFLREISESAKHQSMLEEEMAEEWRKKEKHQENLRERYATYYKQYLEFCDSNDPAAVNYRAKIASNEKATSRAASLTPAAEGRPEGRRAASRFATEHDIARVLQESKREAQEKQERSERAAKAKAATEKEAIIPDMMTLEEYRRECFINTSRLVPFDRAPAILGILPPVDNFTEEESEIFEKTYLDFPKQWSKIAAALPGRDYKNCIQHYYIVKHKDSLKEKLKKKEKGKKKGRATAAASKPRSNALMANLGSRDGETDDGQETVDGERRRPRRAAAPIWPIEQPSESETATPAPTPGRRMASTNKGDTGSESGPTKRKIKSSGREKGPKQPKNGQLLAAAPPTKPRDMDENQTSVQMIDKARGKTPSDSHRYFPQVDGPAPGASVYLPPRPPHELIAGPPSGGLDKGFQTFADGDYGDSPPVSATFDLQHNDRRNANTTSSYWSVPEQTDFPALLQHFGTDWHAIAKHMASKTHIMVKNYYQRQIDSGRQDLEEVSKNADARRARGEPTGPPPTPTVPIKRRYDGPTGALHRSNIPTVETTEELLPTHHPLIIQNVPSPKPPTASRFPTLAQAGPVPQTTQPARTISTSAKPPQSQSQPQQWAQQVLQHPPQSQRGPPLGYFNPPDRERPLLQTTSTQSPVGLSDPHRIPQRSEIVAYEAQLERDQAVRIQEQQLREQQAQNQQAREQHQQAREQHARQQRQRLGEQPGRRQQHSMKSEAEMQNLSQYEPYSSQSQQPSILARSRIDEPSSMYGSDPRRSVPAPPYVTRDPQATREIGSENITVTASGHVSNTQPQIPRTTMTAVLTHQDAPPMAPRPQPPPAVTAIRQQETVRKSYSIMSLLNDEPSEPRPPPIKRNSDGPLASVQPASLPTTTQPPFPPSRSLSSGQSSQIRRKASIGDIQSLTNNYSPPQTSSQGSIRVVESPYSAITNAQAHAQVQAQVQAQAQAQAQAQVQGRSQVSSTLDARPASDRDSYAHQPYGMSRTQQNSSNSPQSGPQYQPTQPAHHQMAFTQSSKRTASPPGQYAPVPGSRSSSFEYGHHVTPSSVPAQIQYSSGPPVSVGYQPAPQTHHSMSTVRFPQTSYSPSYEARESFRPSAPQRPIVDRLQPEQQHAALMRQQMLHQQQQQQQPLPRDEFYHPRRPEERRYEDSRRG